jgi:hypothetical protein
MLENLLAASGAGFMVLVVNFCSGNQKDKSPSGGVMSTVGVVDLVLF